MVVFIDKAWTDALFVVTHDSSLELYDIRVIYDSMSYVHREKVIKTIDWTEDFLAKNARYD